MKVKLTDEEALEIFAQRAHVRFHQSNALTSKELAVRYHVSERTVRDIWSRRTRRDLTHQAWTAEEHLSHALVKPGRGRPFGAKDGVPRQRQVQEAPSNSTQSSNSDTTSEEDSSSRDDSLSSVDTDSSVGQTGTLGMPPRNGLLFNQAIVELLRKGIQQPPPGAPGMAPSMPPSMPPSMAPSMAPAPLSSQFCPVQAATPLLFDALHLPAVPPFTSSQQMQMSLFNGWHTLQQTSRTLPPGQLLEMLKKMAPPSGETTTTSNVVQQFQYGLPSSGAATQTQGLAMPASFAFPGTKQTPPFSFKNLPNNGVVPG